MYLCVLRLIHFTFMGFRRRLNSASCMPVAAGRRPWPKSSCFNRSPTLNLVLPRPPPGNGLQGEQDLCIVLQTPFPQLSGLQFGSSAASRPQ